MFPLARILVPMDDSDLSNKALDTAFTLASSYGAQVWAVFVRKVPTGSDVAYMDDLDVEANEAAIRGNVAERLAGHNLPAESVHTELRTGDPVACILDAARDHKVDLVVMGTHGRKGVLDRLFGSTTERVLTQGHFAMLVLRDPED
jgi:nucleotide-binding universal stress UspA family protein